MEQQITRQLLHLSAIPEGKFTAPPSNTGQVFQDSEGSPKPWVLPNPTYTLFFSYSSILTIKFMINWHSKRLMTVIKWNNYNTYCNKSYVTVTSISKFSTALYPPLL